MATYAWTVEKLYTKNITESGSTYTDAIVRVLGTLTATSETIGSINTSHGVDLDMIVSNISKSFTAYDSVTEDNVKSWIETRIGSTTIEEIKKGLENELEFLENIHGSTPKEDSDGKSTFPW